MPGCPVFTCAKNKPPSWDKYFRPRHKTISNLVEFFHHYYSVHAYIYTYTLIYIYIYIYERKKENERREENLVDIAFHIF